MNKSLFMIKKTSQGSQDMVLDLPDWWMSYLNDIHRLKYFDDSAKYGVSMIGYSVVVF